YKCDVRGDGLPPSSYSLVEQIQGRGVFSFCMCPGGIIAPAATAAEEVVVNGWSPSKRSGKFANSGYVVTVDDRDFAPFEKSGALRALRYQQHWERVAYQISGSLSAPAQRMEDFIQGKVSTNLPENSYLPGLVSSAIGEVLAPAVHNRIRESRVVLGKKMKGFRTNEAILVGVESRTSSPLRIPRLSDSLQHTEVTNLFPCGEGAGYAGGIMSAALDGIRVANAVVETK
ncbi:MAG: NAD(P)/FAD-dependent oxidoreductase, partial [Bacteroidota bacterium]